MRQEDGGVRENDVDDILGTHKSKVGVKEGKKVRWR
jgi:hypothetical protein